MSVYTPVSRSELSAFLARFDVGGLIAYAGIEAGIENTNYFVDTRRGRFVLTIFEWLPAAELPFFLDLMGHLATAGLPSARPIPDREGRLAGELCGKPAALVTRLTGENLRHPNAAQCREVGRTLARWHLATASFPTDRPDGRARAWRTAAAVRIASRLTDEDRRLLSEEIAARETWPDPQLPAGIIHADLFRDNVLFEAGKLTGLLDFYYACKGPFVYDLAVALVDWCFLPAGALDAEAARALVEGYREFRTLGPAEIRAGLPALRAAALRFWLSRLVDTHFPKAGTLTFLKDPAEFRALLHVLRADQAPFLGIFEP